MTRSPLVTWPFVGRDAEVDTVLATLRSGGHAVLVGDVGVGKTTVAAECISTLAADGRSIRRVAASQSAVPVPYAAITTPTPPSNEVDILAVDDADVIDEASAVVIHQLIATSAVQLLMTVRREREVPRPLQRFMLDPSTTVVELGPLDRRHVDEVVAQVLDGHVEARTSRVLLETSGGNPLYLRELINGSIRAGALACHERTWRFVGAVTPGRGVTELLLARLDGLTKMARDGLDLLAIAGTISLDVASSLIAVDVLEDLERLELIVVGEGHEASVAISHPLFGEILGANIGALRRRRAFRTLAETSKPVTGSDLEVVRHALWHVRGAVALDPDRLLAAARLAAAADDTPLAAELASAAYTASRSVESALLSSAYLARIGRQAEAMALAEGALAACADPRGRAALRQRLAEDDWWYSRDLRRAMSWLEPTSAAIRSGASGPADDELGEWRSVLDAQRGVFALLDGDIDAAAASCEPLRAHPLLATRLVAAIALAQAYAYTDRAADGIAVAVAAHAEATEWTARTTRDDLDHGDLNHGDSGQLASASFNGDPNIHLVGQVIGLIHDGRLAEALQLTELLVQATSGRPGLQARAWSMTLHAFVLHFRGVPHQAAAAFAEAEADWVDARLPGLAAWATAGLVLSRCALGAFDEAGQALKRLDEYELEGFRLYAPFVSLGRCWVAWSESDSRTAQVAADQAVADVVDSGATTHRAIVAHDLARIGVLDAAQRAIADLPPPRTVLGAARVAFVVASVGRDPIELERVGHIFASFDLHLFAAEAFARAAEEHRRRRRGSRDHERCAGLAERASAQCPGVSTPPLQRPTGGTILSPRQLQVARLAVDGLTSRQIAERLVIGERSVESHLYRIFIRLGIETRDDLGAALVRSGIHPSRHSSEASARANA